MIRSKLHKYVNTVVLQLAPEKDKSMFTYIGNIMCS